jgi:nucleotide-binding universal stress UspA family protein
MFNTLIWASDGSENADRALGYATELAHSEGAALHAVHVVEKLVGPRVGGMNSHVDEQEIAAKIRAQAEGAGRELGTSVRLHMMASSGAVPKRIAETAADVNADLIIVGTRGHSGIGGALLGSVTQRLLHLTSRPVLAIPPGATPKSSRAEEAVSAAQ